MEFTVDNSFDSYLKEHFNFTLCETLCTERQARLTMKDCCWTCKICQDNEIVVDLNASDTISFDSLFPQQSCSQCNSKQEVKNNTCTDSQEIFMSYKDGISVSLIAVNMLGLLCSLVSCVVMIVYWSTPIIKAFGRETSSIILIGTVLSFTLSIVLLDKPNIVHCYLRVCAPAFCSTVVYAAILTKTNRIARIFGIKLSSKKNSMPRFISPISQINIVLIIVSVECVILGVVMFTAGIQVGNPEDRPGRMWDCLDIGNSGLISIWLVPCLLLICSTVYAFKIRKTPDGFNETRNLNFLNVINCIVFATCMLLHQVLAKDKFSGLPFVLMLTLNGHGILICLFYPKIYITLFRPSKNTIKAITTKSRSFSHLPSISSNCEIPDYKLRKSMLVLSNGNSPNFVAYLVPSLIILKI